MKIVTSKDFADVPATVTNLVAGNVKPIFTVETGKTTFKAHDLDQAMRLWKASKDKSPVVSVGRCG